jgi:hypothetical protein
MKDIEFQYKRETGLVPQFESDFFCDKCGNQVIDEVLYKEDYVIYLENKIIELQTQLNHENSRKET